MGTHLLRLNDVRADDASRWLCQELVPALGRLGITRPILNLVIVESQTLAARFILALWKSNHFSKHCSEQVHKC
ncbi:hypothetical protein MRX96_017818 [Rhipicephalus microplus]